MHRGAVLILALFHVGTGLGLLLGAPGRATFAETLVLYDMIPWPIRSLMWIMAAAIALWFSRTNPKLALVILSIMPAQRAIGQFWSVVMFIVPGVPDGNVTSFGSLLSWLAVLLMIRHIGRWPDLERTAS